MENNGVFTECLNSSFIFLYRQEGELNRETIKTSLKLKNSDYFHLVQGIHLFYIAVANINFKYYILKNFYSLSYPFIS